MNECWENGEEGDKTAAKKTRGRQKIEIKKLEKKNNLQVTFTKRRNGLFKKASELCILTGAKIGMIVLSPSPREKPFCFGHPNIETVLDEYLSEGLTFPDDDAAISTDDPGWEEMNRKYEESLKELEMEKERGKEAEDANNVEIDGGSWWDAAIDGMGLEELEAYMKAVEELKNKLMVRSNALGMANVLETAAAAAAAAQADHGYGLGFAQNYPGFGGDS